MRATMDDATGLSRAIDNVRFLIEQQIRHVDVLDRRGLDQGPALDLLRRLLLEDAELRRRMTAPARCIA